MVPNAALVSPSPPSTVRISFGPIAIRWYRCLYRGYPRWRLLRATSCARKSLGRRPLTLVDYERLVLWGDVRHHPGGRIGYVLFLQSGFSPSIRSKSPTFGLRHSVPPFYVGRRGSRWLCFSLQSGMPFCRLSDITCAVAPICSSPRPHCKFHQWRILGPRHDVPWPWVFPNAGPMPRHPSQIYEALLAARLLRAARSLVVGRRAQRPGAVTGAVHII